jgi:MFS transporter, DHA2 family, multidrug resistance protein
LPWALSFVVGSMLTPRLVQSVRPAYVMAAGMVFAAIGFGLFTRLDQSTGFWTFAIGTTIFSLGMAPVFTLTTDLIVGSAPPERAGAAAAISETAGEFGGALGIAIFGSIGVAVYRAGLPDVLFAGVPAELEQTSRGTLAGALQAPEQIREAAKTAFIRGVQLCAAISTGGAILLAAFAALTLRHSRGGSESSGDQAAAPPEVAQASA